MQAMILSVWLLQAATGPCFGAVSPGEGSSWTYSGTRVRSDGAEGRLSEPVDWTTVVVASVREGRSPRVLVRGFVTELAWSTPETQSRLSILACSDGQLVHFEAQSDDEVREAFDRWDDSYRSRGEVLLQMPLRDGQVFGQDPPREDLLYAWYVEAVDPPAGLPDSCRGSADAGFRTSYRTMPDDRFIDWYPGIGVGSYEYVHHGSPGDVNVALESCSLVRP